ncbi:MAG: protein kinase family protein, partial [Verrucomicrobiota bacterium]
PEYMAPEQASGAVHDLDERVDVYALGAILYEFLTSRSPIVMETGEDIYEVLKRVEKGEIEPPTSNEALGKVAMKALATNRDDRYASVSDFQREIEAWLGGFATEAEQAGLAKQLMLLVKRNKAVFSTAAAAWLLLTVLAIWFVLGLQRSERETRNALGQSQIALAEAAYLAGDGRRALGYLEQAPEAIRDTNWDYLHRYSDESIYRRLSLQGIAFRGVFLDPHESGRSYLHAHGNVLDRIDSRSGERSQSGGRLSRVHLDLGFKTHNLAFALAPDGKHLAVASKTPEHGIRFFRTDTFERVGSLASYPFKSLLQAGFFTGDSRTAVFRSGEDTLTYDLETGESKLIEGVRGLAAIPESSRWIGFRGNQLVAFESDGSPDAVLCSGVSGGILDLSVSHDGAIAAAARANGSIDLYHLKSGERFKTLAAYESITYNVMFSRNSPVLLSLGADGRVGSLRFWSSDPHSQHPLRTIFAREHGYGVPIAWDEEEELILVALAELNIYRAPLNSSTFIHRGQSARYVDENTIAFTFGREDGEPVMVTYDLESEKIAERFHGYDEIVHSRTREISIAVWLEHTSHNETRQFPILHSSPELELEGRPVPKIGMTKIGSLGISPQGRYVASAVLDKLTVARPNSSGHWVDFLHLRSQRGELPAGIVNRQTHVFFPNADSPQLLASFLVQVESTSKRVFQW